MYTPSNPTANNALSASRLYARERANSTAYSTVILRSVSSGSRVYTPKQRPPILAEEPARERRALREIVMKTSFNFLTRDAHRLSADRSHMSTDG
jgi:hypothetical protein